MYSLTNNRNTIFTTGQKIHYTLRVASAMCFIGHGIFGIITKPVWSNYFGVFGIDKATSVQLMPIVGCIDIFMGIIILMYPLRSVVGWLVLWGTMTALLRPLSGEPFAEFIERAGNFGAPLALLIVSGGFAGNAKKLFTPLRYNSHLDERTLRNVTRCLRIVVFLLFAGHGWLNVIEKKSLINQYTMLGFANPGKTAQAIGIGEIAAGLMVLIRPLGSVVLALFIWKITSELFYPHYELFEWVERGGSYGAILALWFAIGVRTNIQKVNEPGSPGFLSRRRQRGVHDPFSNYNLNAV
ncbi:MAG: hypothetical protein ABI472_08870 [Ginsengibacter sp.]